MSNDPNDHYFEGGRIYWKVPDPTTYYMGVSHSGRKIVYGHDQLDSDPAAKDKKRGLFGITWRPAARKDDPGWNLVKRILHGRGEAELRDNHWQHTQPIYGPQAMPHPSDTYFDVPQAFDPPRGGFYDDLGRWHDT